MKIKLNIPNILTLFRIILIPIAVVFVLNNKLTTGFIIYVIACLTDIVDGFIARKFNMITDAGKFLDPLADKVMSISMVITFTILNVLPLFVCIFVVIKELLMISGGILLYTSNIVISANLFGKVSALLFNSAIAFTFLYKTVENAYLYLMYLAMAFAFASLIQYMYLNLYKRYFLPKKDLKKESENSSHEALN